MSPREMPQIDKRELASLAAPRAIRFHRGVSLDLRLVVESSSCLYSVDLLAAGFC